VIENSYPKARELAGLYLQAKQVVIKKGYGFEIDWQDTRNFTTLTESEFLQESAWVVLCTGMKELVIRRIFQNISASFMNWKDAATITENAEICESKAIAVFNHPRKISAILSLCKKVSELGFENIRYSIQRQGVDFLRTFDFIGPITCYHLAKNIGLDVVKPDRHLVRIAKATKMPDPYDLCCLIARMTGDRISVVDLVLWRYATLHPKYMKSFI
jgi:hypothetical protein